MTPDQIRNAETLALIEKYSATWTALNDYDDGKDISPVLERGMAELRQIIERDPELCLFVEQLQEKVRARKTMAR